jgi:hypothetical protein
VVCEARMIGFPSRTLGNMIGSFLHDEERRNFRVQVGNLFLMERGWNLSVIVSNVTIATLEWTNCDTQM